MSPASFTWTWLKTQIVTGFDRYVGRWTNVWMNAVMCVMFVVVAFFLKEGWGRDIWWFAAGTFAGYTFMWLTAPRFNKARKREMEAEIAIMMAGLHDRINKHSMGFARMLQEAEDDNGKPGRLQ